MLSKAQAPAQSTESRQAAATARQSDRPAGAGPALTDIRLEAVAQRELAEAIERSPRVAAQRGQVESRFGVAQRREREEFQVGAETARQAEAIEKKPLQRKGSAGSPAQLNALAHARGGAKPTMRATGTKRGRTRSNVSPALPLQRYPDEDHQLEESEKPALDNFLTHNFGAVAHFTQQDYTHLEGLYQTLLEAEGSEDVVGAWDDVYEYADGNILQAGKNKWEAAVLAGAQDVELAPNADPLARWPGRTQAPAEFGEAVGKKVAARKRAREKEIADAYQSYIDDSRLLPGTIGTIKAQLAIDFQNDAKLADVNARLALVYERQCKVSRENWLLHLGIAGRNINGSTSLHYTKYNDCVPDSLPDDLRVDNKTVEDILSTLFLSVDWQFQMHATRVLGDVSYHRYYNGYYSPFNPDDSNLEKEWKRMKSEMQAGVEKARSDHGRVGRNARAQQVVVTG